MQSPSTEEIVQRLLAWRQAHPQATFDEIDEEVARQFAGLQAQVVETLSQPEQRDAGAGEVGVVADDPPRCPQCQTAMQRRGQRRRRVPTRQGQEVVLQRAYYVCPACGAGRFPPG
jgi:uncharacterized protein with PIN domain